MMIDQTVISARFIEFPKRSKVDVGMNRSVGREGEEKVKSIQETGKTLDGLAYLPFNTFDLPTKRSIQMEYHLFVIFSLIYFMVVTFRIVV